MAKTPHAVDVHVGNRVRMRRIMLGLSQPDLGNACGITFQQIQKYENGSNRISASRLVEFATTLKVPVAWFFEGLEAGQGHPDDVSNLGLTAMKIAREASALGPHRQNLVLRIVRLLEPAALDEAA